MERLQKRIAHSGVTSRRKAEELIKAGRVKVNGQVITEMGYLVGPKDTVEVDSVQLETEEKRYYCLNKPRGVISSVSDDRGRKTIIDILPPELKQYRLYPVGRLDYDTKGIILITNDGDFTNLMIGPNSGIQKEYLVRVKGIINDMVLAKLEKGLKTNIAEYLPALCEIESIDKRNQSSLVRIILTEGQNHQVKEMFEAIGYPVKRLTRVRFGNITIENLPEGAVRSLSIHEVKQLRVLATEEKILKREPIHKYRIN